MIKVSWSSYVNTPRTYPYLGIHKHADALNLDVAPIIVLFTSHGLGIELSTLSCRDTGGSPQPVYDYDEGMYDVYIGSITIENSTP